jgi:hypothetical protein
LITNDPHVVLAFRRKHGAVIFKSMSGIRSIVRTLCEDDLDRLEQIRWGPVQFQHSFQGSTCAFMWWKGTCTGEIISDTLDYRYARRGGGVAELRAIRLSLATMKRNSWR